jgi:DNA-binding IclR family transcriptional regulator
VFLADVEAARRRGYAVESGEFLTGVSGVAVPVLVGGQPLGAIGVVGPTSRCKRRQLDVYGRLTRDLLAGRMENTARRKAD